VRRAGTRSDLRRSRRRLSLPRGAYWTLGAAIALGGALAGRFGGDSYPDHRMAIWLAASVVVFIGLAVLSLGTRWRQETDRPE
jgi:hypothetical protein